MAGAPRAEPVARGLEALGSVQGARRSVVVADGETLVDIAHRERVGFRALQQLNPGTDVWQPIPGSVLRLPTDYIVPDVPREGLVINVPEMRLYDFTVGAVPDSIAVAVGDPDDPTPIGAWRIGAKRVDPVWNVPESILRERPGQLPRVPPGPDNPLGSRWMTIGATSYGIHGTNVRWSIGRTATHGCVRLYEPDMLALYDRTPEGTPVRIIYQPVKWGRMGARIFIEVHPDLYGRMDDVVARALEEPVRLRLLPWLDLERLRDALKEARGVPVPVGEAVPPGASPYLSS